MKRTYIITAFLCIATLVLHAQRITFTFQDGIRNGVLKNQMEATISALLTEFNTAYNQHRRLQLDNFNLSEKAKKSLQFNWDSIATFTCDFDQNVSRCLTATTGYEVREIYVTMHPRRPSEYSGTLNREFSIGFDKTSGQILHARVTLEDNTYRTVMSQGSDVTDMRRRMEILKFVEDFRSFYDEKDIKSLERIYSDDALIITGTVMKPDPNMRDRAARLRPEIKYNRFTKKQYIESLKGIFSRNKYIKVKFEDISVVKHPAKDNFYGVALKQNWKSMNGAGGIRYEDDGYLFLLWEFPEEEGGQPLVHVRTWQPEKDKNGHIILDEDERFTVNDFFVP